MPFEIRPMREGDVDAIAALSLRATTMRDGADPLAATPVIAPAAVGTTAT